MCHNESSRGRPVTAALFISGGEAQKIALAGALYKDGAVMILDEPTAALDPLAEYEFCLRPRECSKEKTAIYISQFKFPRKI